MRAHLLPPPARYPFGPTRGLAWPLAALAGAGLVVLIAWLALGLGSSARLLRALAAVALWLACTGCAWRWWRCLPRGELYWDGAGWSLLLAARPQALPLRAAPEVRLDVQQALLVHARPLQGRAQWLWLQAGARPAQWAPLRRALYSRAPVAPGRRGDAPAAPDTPS